MRLRSAVESSSSAPLARYGESVGSGEVDVLLEKALALRQRRQRFRRPAAPPMQSSTIHLILLAVPPLLDLEKGPTLPTASISSTEVALAPPPPRTTASRRSSSRAARWARRHTRRSRARDVRQVHHGVAWLIVGGASERVRDGEPDDCGGLLTLAFHRRRQRGGDHGRGRSGSLACHPGARTPPRCPAHRAC